MKLFNRAFIVTIIILMLTVALSSCSNSNSQNTQALQEQIYQLQTQNALLKSNGVQTINPNDQEPSLPVVPGEDPTPDVQVITATPESLPQGPIPAGQPIIFDNWSMIVNSEIGTTQNYSQSAFDFTVTVRNLSDKSRVFRYVINSITVTDDKGNAYKPTYMSSWNCESNNGISTNITIEAEDSQKLDGSGSGFDCGKYSGLRDYQGPIPVSVKQLHVHFKDFGPFDGVEVVIDL